MSLYFRLRIVKLIEKYDLKKMSVQDFFAQQDDIFNFLPQLDVPEAPLDEIVKKHGFGKIHIDVFDKYIENIPDIIISQNGSVKTHDGRSNYYSKVVVESPKLSNGGLLYPIQAKTSFLSYNMTIYADIHSVMEGEDIEDRVPEFPKQKIGSVPCMVGSSKCNLRNILDITDPEERRRKLLLVGEDPDDVHSYFIIRGTEKILFLLEQMSYDKVILQETEEYYKARNTVLIPMATRALEVRMKKSSRVKHGKSQFQKLNIIKIALQSFTKKEATKTKANAFNVTHIFKILGLKSNAAIVRKIREFIDPKKERLINIILPFTLTLGSKANDPVSSNPVNVIVERYRKSHPKKVEDIADSHPDWKENLVDSIIETDVFPNLNSLPSKEGETAEEYILRIKAVKIDALAIMVARLIELVGGRSPDDNDSWSNKRLEGPGRISEQLLRNCWRRMQYPQSRPSASLLNVGNLFKDVGEFIAKSIKKTDLITNSFHDSFVTPKWGVRSSGKFASNYAQPLQRESMAIAWSYIYMVNVNVSRTSVIIKIRMPHDSAQYFIDLIYTSEGGPCGLLKNLAIGTVISLQRDDSKFINLVYKNHVEGGTLVLVNSKPVGRVNEKTFINLIRDMKRDPNYFDISIYKTSDDAINIETNSSRLLRPVYVLEKLRKNYKTMAFKDLLDQGIVEYISPAEQEQAHFRIAEDEEMIQKLELDKKAVQDHINELNRENASADEIAKEEKNLRHLVEQVQFSHMEIDKTLIMGFVSALIPRPDTNQGPRDTYAGQMIKQETSIPLTNHRYLHNLSMYKTTHGAVKPLFHTSMYKRMGLYTKGTGYNPYTFLQVTTQTEEDAWKVNKAYLQRGAYRHTKWSTYSDFIRFSESSSSLMKQESKVTGKRPRNFFIQEHGRSRGIIALGAPVRKDDVLISRLKGGRDSSFQNVKVKPYDQGVVDSIIYTNSALGTEISIKIRWTRVPQKGDKYAPINAQKATIGTVVDQWCLPFDVFGVSPAFTATPLCFPTRMTMEYMYEFLASNVAVASCSFVDATPFNKEENHFKYRKILRSLDKDQMCKRDVYSGLSGRRLKNRIEVGHIHLMALRHHVEDKYQARTLSGPNSEFNNQPVQGRSNIGGLRLGEMEHDCMISHGAADLGVQFLTDSSDPFVTFMCKCGKFADYNARLGTFKPCPRHKDVELGFGKIKIPYSYKLLMQILAPMGIDLAPECVTPDEYTKMLLEGTLYNESSKSNAITEKLVDEEGDDEDGEEGETLENSLMEALIEKGDDFHNDADY